jgi:hypothetical protein
MGARIARSENLDKAPEGAGWEDSYASRARSDGRFAQTFAVAYVPEFFATLKTPTSFVFGDWSASFVPLIGRVRCSSSASMPD